MKHLQLISGFKMNLIKKSTYTEAEFIEMLETLESGHTDADYCIDPDNEDSKRPRDVLKADVIISGKRIPFRIAGDTKYKGISEVLRSLKSGGRIEVVTGPRKGVKFGIDGKYVKSFQVYLTDKNQIEEFKDILKSAA